MTSGCFCALQKLVLLLSGLLIHQLTFGHNLTVVEKLFFGFRTEWSSRSLVAIRLQFLGDKVDSCRVTKHAQSTNDTDCLVAQKAAVSELFSGVNIADVDFQEWNCNACESVAQSYACVGEAARIDNDELGLSAGIVNPVDDGTFVVGLEIFNFDSQVLSL